MFFYNWNKPYQSSRQGYMNISLPAANRAHWDIATMDYESIRYHRKSEPRIAWAWVQRQCYVLVRHPIYINGQRNYV